jgi:broad specificity phosphatase PhoE
MNIFLVRHGEAAASWGESPDPGLSELGWHQARETALQLRPQVNHDTLLLSSPLLRARQTADPLAGLLGREVQEAEVFREVPAPVPLAQRQGWLRQFMQQTWDGQGNELVAWRAAALAQLSMLEQPAVVFTHFLVINALVGHALNDARIVCFWPANGSVTRLRLIDSTLELMELGRQMESIVN